MVGWVRWVLFLEAELFLCSRCGGDGGLAVWVGLGLWLGAG